MNGDETQMPFCIYYTRSVAPVPLPITHLYPRALSRGFTAEGKELLLVSVSRVGGAIETSLRCALPGA